MTGEKQSSRAILAKRVLEERLARGISQEALGEATGMSQNTVNRIEAGETNIGMEKIEALARFFGATVVDLYTANEDQVPALEELRSDSQKQIFSINLRNIAAKKQLSVATLAYKAELNLATVRSYFAGNRTPTSTSLHKLIKALAIEPSDLFRKPGTELPKPKPTTPDYSLELRKLEIRIQNLEDKLNTIDERILRGFATIEAILKRRFR